MSSLKEIKVSFSCTYEVEQTTPGEDVEVAVPFVGGPSNFTPFPADNLSPFEGKFTFTTPDAPRCPMTQVLRYASEADYESNTPMAGMPVPYEDLVVPLTTDNQGRFEYFFAITG